MDKFIIKRFEDIIQEKILEEYKICNNQVTISITKSGKYMIKEPPLSAAAEDLYNQTLHTIRHEQKIVKINYDTLLTDLKHEIENESKRIKKLDVYLGEKKSLDYYIERDIIGYSIIHPLVVDDRLEDILCTKWDLPISVKHRDYPFFFNMATNVVFPTQNDLIELINRISGRYGEIPSQIKPISSFTDNNKVRFTVTANNIITANGAFFSIRIPSKNPITIYHILKSKSLSYLAAAYIWMMIDLRGFGLIIGAPASGKTTLINALFTITNPLWHYFTIEDTLELNLRQFGIVTTNKTSSSSLNLSKREYDYGIFDLLKLSMRAKPEFVIVGEVLGEEAKELFHVAQSGCGLVSSFHASTPLDTLHKLQGSEFNVTKEQLSSLSYILHVKQIPIHNVMKRITLNISEPQIVASGNNESVSFKGQLTTIFEYDEKEDKLLPEDVDAVIKKSIKLKNATMTLGIKSVKEDLEKRINILKKIVNENIMTPEEITKEINLSYYQTV